LLAHLEITNQFQHLLELAINLIDFMYKWQHHWTIA